jgi:hypothetical protein
MGARSWFIFPRLECVMCARACVVNRRALSLSERLLLAHHFWNKHILDHGHKFTSHLWQKVRGAHEAQ